MFDSSAILRQEHQCTHQPHLVEMSFAFVVGWLSGRTLVEYVCVRECGHAQFTAGEVAVSFVLGFQG